MSEVTEENQTTIITPSAAQAAGLSNMNMSSELIEVMMRRAYQYPRDIEKVRDTCWKELEFVPELAARSYYSIPYNQGKQNETRVEGPSIKAAMTLCRNWGNCFNQGRFQDEDKSNIITQGIFFDLQTNSPTIREIRVSKFYKPRGSQGVVPKNADMLYNSVQAGISKAVRNAVLASLPDWLVTGYFNHAKHLVINPPKKAGETVVSIQERIVKGKAAICKAFKVTPEEMETYLTENADSIEDDAALLAHLMGLYTSLKEGQAIVDQVFRPNQQRNPPEMPQEK